MNKTMVTVSRYWSRPEIITSVNIEEISLKISLVDFLDALKSEIGSVTFVVTQKTFYEKMDSATKIIIEKIKEESSKVV